MLMLFMLFCSLTPFLLWSGHRRWALLQWPLIIGMWIYPVIDAFSDQTPTLLKVLFTVLFYANLLYTEAALVLLVIDFGRYLKKKEGNLT